MFVSGGSAHGRWEVTTHGHRRRTHIMCLRLAATHGVWARKPAQSRARKPSSPTNRSGRLCIWLWRHIKTRLFERNFLGPSSSCFPSTSSCCATSVKPHRNMFTLSDSQEGGTRTTLSIQKPFLFAMRHVCSTWETSRRCTSQWRRRFGKRRPFG